MRTHCRSLRKHLSEEDYRIECRKIILQATSVQTLRNAKTILSYWPKLASREIDLRPLNCWLRTRGCTVLLPIIEPNSIISRMHWGHFDHERTLMLNRWGILQPGKRADISAEDIDIVLVPGLGFDRRGHRIGYGGGYYDRFFESVHAYKIGLSLDCCVVEMIPNQPYDVPIDCLVTSNGTLKLN